MRTVCGIARLSMLRGRPCSTAGWPPGWQPFPTGLTPTKGGRRGHCGWHANRDRRVRLADRALGQLPVGGRPADEPPVRPTKDPDGVRLADVDPCPHPIFLGHLPILLFY